MFLSMTFFSKIVFSTWKFIRIFYIIFDIIQYNPQFFAKNFYTFVNIIFRIYHVQRVSNTTRSILASLWRERGGNKEKKSSKGVALHSLEEIPRSLHMALSTGNNHR